LAVIFWLAVTIFTVSGLALEVTKPLVPIHDKNTVGSRSGGDGSGALAVVHYLGGCAGYAPVVSGGKVMA